MPLSRNLANTNIQPPTAMGINEVVAIAKALHMHRYQLHMPAAAEGVFTLSANTISGDISDPRLDRTVHIDQYSGEVLVDIGFSDYSLLAKAMAVGVALHKGNASWVNLLINTLLCMVFSLICITAIVMWWQRRPKGSQSINAPKRIVTHERWYAGLIALLIVAMFFPLTGVAIAAFAVIDLLLASVKRLLRGA